MADAPNRQAVRELNVSRFGQYIHNIYRNLFPKALLDTFLSYVRMGFLKEENETLSTFLSDVTDKISSSGHTDHDVRILHHLLRLAHSLYTRQVPEVVVYAQDPERTIVLYRPTLDEADVRLHVHEELIKRGVPVLYIKWGDPIPSAEDPAGGPVPNETCCGFCGKENANQLCSRCKAVRYCNAECQLADWKEHKKVCKASNTIKKGGRRRNRNTRRSYRKESRRRKSYR